MVRILQMGHKVRIPQWVKKSDPLEDFWKKFPKISTIRNLLKFEMNSKIVSISLLFFICYLPMLVFLVLLNNFMPEMSLKAYF